MDNDPVQILKKLKEKSGPVTADEIDPNATATTHRELVYFEHPSGEDGVVSFDRSTLEIQPGNYTAQVLKVDPVFLEVPQRWVATCSEPSERNRGCNAWGGCPYGRKGMKGVGPFTMIVERGRIMNTCPCHQYYYTPGPSGDPTQVIAFRHSGWRIVLDRTSITVPTYRYVWDQESQQKKLVGSTLEMQISDLGPMYSKLLKAKRAEGVERGDHGAATEGAKIRGRRGRKQSVPETGGDGGVRPDLHGKGREGGDRNVRLGRRPRRGEAPQEVT